ncbi:LysR family transcriptional regulator [Shewanella canadensis]|nr:LysR family transcriptional regulator [Shewanella canadensis]
MDKFKAMTIFSAVVEEGTMSAAARRLGIANSVVTKNLNQLEHWLDRKLIYRSTRNLQLSQEGRLYYEQIKEIIHSVEKLESPTNLDHKTMTGSIKITSPIIFGKQLLSPLLPAFHIEYPGINIELILHDDFDDLVKGGFDLALRVSRLPDSNFIAKRLQSMRLRVVASPAYIELHGAPSTPESLSRHICLIDKSIGNAKRWDFISLRGDNLSVPVYGPLSINNAECIAQLCTDGIGVSQLPEIFVNDLINNGQLVELLPEYAIDDFYISLLYHQKGATNPATKAFIDHLTKNLSEK